MTWSIHGNSDALALGISESGHPYINGTASNHKPSSTHLYASIPTTHGEVNIKFCEKLSGLEFLWDISPTNATELQIDGSGDGLYERSKNSPESSHGCLKYFTEPDSIVASIVLPPEIFKNVWPLFHDVLLEPNLVYCIQLDFHGFRKEGAVSDTPTIKEFVDDKPYFVDEVSFSFCRRKNKT